MKARAKNLLYFGYMFLLGLYISSLQSSVTKLGGELGGFPWLMSLFVTLHFVGSMLSPAVAGEISDRVGKKPVLIGFSLLMAAGMAMLAAHPNAFVAGAGILLVGASLSALEGQMSATLSDQNPGRSEKALNDSQVFNGVGAVLGPMLMLALTKAGGGWELGIWIIVALFAGATLWLWKTPIAGAREPERQAGRPAYTGILLRDKLFLALAAAIFLYVAVEQAVAFHINTLFTASREELAAFSLSGFWGGMIVMRFLSARLHRHIGKIMVVSIGAACAELMLLQAGLSPYLDAALLLLLGASLAVIWPLLMSVSAQKFSACSGTASGLMMMSGGLGGMAGPAGVGLAVSSLGVHHALLLPAAGAALIGVLWWRAGRVAKRRRPEGID